MKTSRSFVMATSTPPNSGRFNEFGYMAPPSDIETELDYFIARYYSWAQGRFLSVDPLTASAHWVASRKRLS